MKKVKVPKRVKIGYKTYTIEKVTPFEGDSQVGQCDNALSRIQYLPVGKEIEDINTVLHEILHGCFYVGGLGNRFKTSEEEEIINILTNMFMGVLVDNPEFKKYLMSSYKS